MQPDIVTIKQAAYEAACQGVISTPQEAAAWEYIKALEGRLSAVEASRRAYASEFPSNDEGEPDVGSIHQNIRSLKAALETAAPTFVVDGDKRASMQPFLDYCAKVMQEDIKKLEEVHSGADFRTKLLLTAVMCDMTSTRDWFRENPFKEKTDG